MTTPKFTVAIVGGGIAGLTSAITMSRLNPDNNIRIDIYEGARAFVRPSGTEDVVRVYAEATTPSQADGMYIVSTI